MLMKFNNIIVVHVHVCMYVYVCNRCMYVCMLALGNIRFCQWRYIINITILLNIVDNASSPNQVIVYNENIIRFHTLVIQ